MPTDHSMQGGITDWRQHTLALQREAKDITLGDIPLFLAFAVIMLTILAVRWRDKTTSENERRVLGKEFYVTMGCVVIGATLLFTGVAVQNSIH